MGSEEEGLGRGHMKSRRTGPERDVSTEQEGCIRKGVWSPESQGPPEVLGVSWAGRAGTASGTARERQIHFLNAVERSRKGFTKENKVQGRSAWTEDEEAEGKEQPWSHFTYQRKCRDPYGVTRI